MRFLSDILAKAGLIVDGAAVFNSSATGQTPASNDNSTKFATTAWVRTFVQPYTLPIASASVLGGIKVGNGLAIDAVTGVLSVSNGGVSIKASQTFTATAGQTVFTIAGGYTPGLIDVFLNGIYFSPGQTTATNGTTVTLADAASAGDIIDVIITSPISSGYIANTDNLPEGSTNLYYTTARARAAISLTTTGVSGAASYNNITGVFNIPNYQGLVPANGVAGQILAKASGTSYDTTWIDNYTSQVKHFVKLGENMSAGTPVYVPITQDAGTNMTVMKASNSSEGTSSKTMGLIATAGVTGDFVYVFTEGLLAGIDTSTASKGDPVWLGANGTLIFGLVNKPVAPNHLVFLGIVTRAQQNNGEIFVKVQNGFELEELHNVLITTPSTGDGLFYETVAGVSLWKNKSIATVLGYTPANAATTITINGVSYDLSANRSWTIAGGVTSFNTRTGAITLTSGDVTTALGFTPYNATNPSGYITSSALSSYLPLSGGTLTGALSGTSATFSGGLTLNRASAGAANGYVLQTSGTSNWYVGSSAIGANSDFQVYNHAAAGVVFNIANSSGAATFSSSVSIGGAFNFPNGSISSVGELSFTASAPNIYTYGRYAGTNAGRIIFNNGTGANLFFGELASNIYGFTAGGYNSTPGLTMDMVNYRVGIGTTSPIANLHVFATNGNGIAIGQNSTSSYLSANLFLYPSDATVNKRNWALTTYYDRPELLQFRRSSTVTSNPYDNGVTVMTLDGLNDRVGIGTISPVYKLDVVETGGIVARFIGGSGAYMILRESNSGKNWWIANGINSGNDGMFGIYDASRGVNVFTIASTNGYVGVNTTNPLAPLHVNGDTRTTGLRLNQGTNNQGHRIYSRTMDVSAYTSQTSMRFTVASGNNVQFQYEVTFHATRLSGNLVEIWYLRYTGGVAYDTAGNPNERWWDLREQAGNGIAGVGRNNNTGNLEITNSAFDTSCRLTVCVKITCNNWDAVTVSFS